MKISVIIPVYNAEKYLGACLESILIQTLQDFEVLVVDDCSTDNSPAIAESFLEKFGGRLKIIYLPENTGSGAVPRNVGLDLSCGKYIFFVDADDLIIDTALEELFNTAENFQADLVYMEKGFHCDETIIPQNLTEVSWNPPEFVSSTPTFEKSNIGNRIDKLFKRAIAATTCTKFLRRDVLIDNNIKFPNIKPSEDVIWTIKLLCLAKSILRIQSPLYVYRQNNDSMTGKKRAPEEEIKFWLDPLVKGLDYLDDFMNELDFFAQNPNYRFDVTNFFVKMQIAGMLDALKHLNRYELYEIIRREFSSTKYSALIAYLFVVMNFYRDKSLEVK